MIQTIEPPAALFLRRRGFLRFKDYPPHFS